MSCQLFICLSRCRFKGSAAGFVSVEVIKRAVLIPIISLGRFANGLRRSVSAAAILSTVPCL